MAENRIGTVRCVPSNTGQQSNKVNSALTGNHSHYHVRKPRSDGHSESFPSLYLVPLAYGVAKPLNCCAAIVYPGSGARE